MKTLIYIMAIVGFISPSYAQDLVKAEVPATIQKAFSRSYPKINNVEWKQTADSYTANYKENELERSVIYNATGKQQQKEEQITLADLPTHTLKYINDNHPDGTVKKIKKVTKKSGKSIYVVSIKGLELLFDSGGNYMKPTLE
ncbi:MAG: PepSY-like domain-containing protein [Bacteroidales bacterium]|nr:PepSY-like domain-containing protein [Bacteroidales bacterium]